MNPLDKCDEEAERTLNLFTKINRVQSNPYLADKVMRRIAEQRDERPAFTPRAYRLALAGLLLLIIGNVFSLVEIRSHGSTQENADPVQSIVAEYHLTANGYSY